MTKLDEPDIPGVDRHVWVCDCGCCYLRAVWDKDDPDYRFLWLEAGGKSDRWRDRLGSASRILRGNTAGHAELVLNTHAVHSLRRFLDDST